MNAGRLGAHLACGTLAALVVLSLAGRAYGADALPEQIEAVPKSGQGRVVVVVSGQTGPTNYSYYAYDLAAQGYFAVLVDGNDFFGKESGGEEKLRDVMARAQKSPHALPGKVAVVGFSLGGASTLTYAARMPDLVAVVVTYYPLTRFITRPDDFVSKLKVPTLVMAGGRDSYKDCCRIETARKLAEAAKSVEGTPRFELVEYPDAEHGFTIKSGKTYRSRDAEDGFKRTLAFLKENLGE